MESSSFGAVAEQPPAAEASGEYAELYSSVWVAHLRAKLADECLRLGLQDLDASVIQRALSLGAARSSLPAMPTKRAVQGHDLENWAIFEPSPIRPGESRAISPDEEDFLKALDILGLKLSTT